MKIFTYLAIIYLFNFTINAQVSEVKSEVKDAYGYYEDAFKKIKSAKSYISYAFEAETIDDVQSYASDAESDLSSAKRYIGNAEDDASDAEDEASSLDCDDAENSASDAEDYFYDAKRKISNAISELSSASYEDDSDNLSAYLNSANSYIAQTLTKLSYAVDELNETLQNIGSCGAPTETSYYSNSEDTPTCEALLGFIKSNGFSKGTLSSYTLDSEWLYEVKAYSYQYKIYVVAKIKKSEYGYNTNTYIFCGISSTNWSNFKNGTYGDADSFGERFHKYIFDYKCDCN